MDNMAERFISWTHGKKGTKNGQMMLIFWIQGGYFAYLLLEIRDTSFVP